MKYLKDTFSGTIFLFLLYIFIYENPESDRQMLNMEPDILSIINLKTQENKDDENIFLEDIWGLNISSNSNTTNKNRSSSINITNNKICENKSCFMFYGFINQKKEEKLLFLPEKNNDDEEITKIIKLSIGDKLTADLILKGFSKKEIEFVSLNNNITHKMSTGYVKPEMYKKDKNEKNIK